ncbi:nuclear transport factor 2 family protein [Micromonospora sp. NPDC000207]|uniref:nuclear transport factor 2 family protein n=1 Tax=Micromonospora sp. NPDC000207 TaxID=3154246 RepID=UPI00332A19F1
MTVPTPARRLVEEYYALIDGGKLPEACELMTEDVKLTFANAEPVYGRAAAASSIQYVLDCCDSIKHDVVTFFETTDADGTRTAFIEIRIKYFLKNGKVLDNPGAVVATVDGEGRFTEQRLYGDLNEVFVP